MRFSARIGAGIVAVCFCACSLVLGIQDHELAAPGGDASVDVPSQDVVVLDTNESDAASDAGSDAGSPYRQQVLSDNPLAYWRLGEDVTPTANDETGHGNSCTYVGAITLSAQGAIAGDLDTAATLAGSAYVQCGDKFGFEGTAAFSLEAWVKPSTTNAGYYPGLLTKNDPTDAGTGGYTLSVYGSALYVRLVRAGTSTDALLSPAGITAGAYAHVVATYDTVTSRLFVNGAAVSAQASGASLPKTTQPFSMGAATSPTTGTFHGTIDEVAVYDHVLPPARILAHYHVGMGLAP